MMEFVKTILKPKMRRYFLRNKKAVDLTLDCGIGIDVGDIFVVRGGVKGGNNNDLVWVGNPTNYAVKLSAQSKKVTTPTTLANAVKQQTQPSTEIYNIHITNRVYSNLRENLKTKLGLLNMKINIWERQPILLRSLLPGSLANTTIYRTNKTLPL